jgi:type IV secretion system protein VirB10
MAETTAAAPKGVLPKNLQTWVLLGITAIVVVVIALAGNDKPKPPTAKAAGGAVPEAQAQTQADQVGERLAQLKADAERAQQEALAMQTMLASQQQRQGMGLEAPSMGASPAPGAEDELRKQQAQREYSSLFASQLARSYRAEAPVAAGPAPVAGAAPAADTQAARLRDPRLVELDRQIQSLDVQGQQLLDAMKPTPAAAPPAAPAAAPRPVTTARNQAVAGAQHYVLLEGTVLESALLTRLNSDFAGPVIVQTTAPVYTRNMQHVLIPSGSRVLGEAKRTEAFGQTRLAVVFHRLLMPDGYSIDLDQFTGISARGESALADQVNRHYVQIFGTSIALGMLGGLSSIGTSPVNPTTFDQFRMGGASSFGQSATHVLDKFLNIMPTITIREGHRMRVWIAQDIALPAYEAHAMPGNL